MSFWLISASHGILAGLVSLIRPLRFLYVRTRSSICLALRARSHATWGIAPGFRSDDRPALKVRFNALVHPRFYIDWFGMNRAFSAKDFGVTRIPGALPQAAYECRAFGAKRILTWERTFFWRFDCVSGHKCAGATRL